MSINFGRKFAANPEPNSGIADLNLGTLRGAGGEQGVGVRAWRVEGAGVPLSPGYESADAARQRPGGTPTAPGALGIRERLLDCQPGFCLNGYGHMHAP